MLRIRASRLNARLNARPASLLDDSTPTQAPSLSEVRLSTKTLPRPLKLVKRLSHKLHACVEPLDLARAYLLYVRGTLARAIHSRGRWLAGQRLGRR